MRTIKIPAGIGDAIFLAQKLLNANEQFKFEFANDVPQRGKQVIDLLPQLGTATYGNFTSPEVLRHNIQEVRKEWKKVRDHDFYLSANKHLEEGKRIEQFLPDLSTSFKIDYQTKEFEKEAKTYLGGAKRTIAIYCSAYSPVRSWGFWREKEWMELIDRLNTLFSNQVTFVMIGAEFDQDLTGSLMYRMLRAKMPFIDTVGAPLGVVVELLKRCQYFIGFPSGLSILANTIDVPTMMFYPKHLEKMMNTWPSKESIQDNSYKGLQFCTPDEAFRWLVDVYKIGDKV